MNRVEAAKVLAVLQTAYPMFYRNQTMKQTNETINLWADLFADRDYTLVIAAVRALIATRTETFPPTFGSVNEMIQRITTPELSPLEAWGYVSFALRNGIYGAEEEWAKLPECVQKAITPEQIREWASDDNFNENVASSNFMKSYAQSRKSERELDMMPESIRIATKEALKKLTERPASEAKPRPLLVVEHEPREDSGNSGLRERLIACRAEVV